MNLAPKEAGNIVRLVVGSDTVAMVKIGRAKIHDQTPDRMTLGVRHPLLRSRETDVGHAAIH